MKKEKRSRLDRAGVDDISETIGLWLQEAGADRRNVIRIRMIMEDLLVNVCENAEKEVQAELSLLKGLGSYLLRIRYDGKRYDPSKPAENEAEEFTSRLLAGTGLIPVWRWRSGRNELILHISDPKKRPERLMLVCIAAAVIVGLLGPLIPEGFKTAVIDYGLSFLSGGFLNLLNTFIGLMIFLTVLTGICGLGSTAALGRVGKKMITRFIAGTFLVCGCLTAAVRFFYPLGSGGGTGGSGVMSILKMIFGILPASPVQPFLEGNTLQIVFMAVLIGVVLLMTGSQTENLRKLISEAQTVVMHCVSAVCMFLPVYIFSSLVSQLWMSGPQMLISFAKPICLSAVLSACTAGLYLAYTCMKLKLKPAVLMKKLLPDFIIALSTSSSAAAFAAGMEINEKQLGIAASFSRVGFPIGGLLCAGGSSLVYILAGAFAASRYGVSADIVWWITMWLVSSLLGMATPPVAGGFISCLAVLFTQLHIPAEGLAAGVALVMLMDFFCTGARVPVLHMELILQADKLGLLDRNILMKEE